MVVFNPLKKEIDIKIVYYGPALCGKTTNLQSVHLSLNPDQRGELVSLATKDDRTLFFDFLPIELDNIQGFKTRFHIYTVPGQVLYTLTRKAVLTGVDGIIFVADSQEDKMEENIESLDDLRENLKYYNKELGKIPFVMQYNKRDLSTLVSLDEMERQLNTVGAPSFEASAVSGKGVMETLTMCCKMVLKQIQEKSNLAQAPRQEVKQPQENIQESSPELPQLTLVDESEPDDETVGGEQEQQQSMTESLIENGVEEVAVTAGLIGSEEPNEQIITQEDLITDTEHDISTGNDLLEKEPEIQFDDPELQLEEVGEEQVDNILQNVPEAPDAMEPLHQDPLPVSSGSAIENPPLSDDLVSQERRNTCPRCSLKFKPNVKQCPICRVNLLSDGGEITDDATSHDAAPEPLAPFTQGQPTSAAVAEGTNGGNGLEIVSCGQPSKTSHTAIRVPLTLKVNGTAKEFAVDLAIDFGNGLLK